MKNNFAAFVRYLEEQGRIKIESDAECVYIMGAHVALKVLKAEYSYFIRPLSGVFPEIHGIVYAEKNSYEPVAKIVEASTCVKELFEKTAENARVQLEKSAFLFESAKQLYRIFGSEAGSICAVNKEYVDMIECCIYPNSFMSAGGPLDVLFARSDVGAALVSPFRIGGALEFWKGKTF